MWLGLPAPLASRVSLLCRTQRAALVSRQLKGRLRPAAHPAGRTFPPPHTIKHARYVPSRVGVPRYHPIVPAAKQPLLTHQKGGRMAFWKLSSLITAPAPLPSNKEGGFEDEEISFSSEEWDRWRGRRTIVWRQDHLLNLEWEEEEDNLLLVKGGGEIPFSLEKTGKDTFFYLEEKGE